MKSFLSPNNGYIAISSMLVISAIVLTLSISISLLSVSEADMALAHKKREEVRALVEACAEDALLTLNETSALPSTRVFPDGSCNITTNSQSGTSWTFTATGTVEQHTHSVQVTAERTTTVAVTSWVEVE